MQSLKSHHQPLLTLLIAGVTLSISPAASAQTSLSPRIKWRAPVQGRALVNYIATAPNGTVYVNSDERLMALDPDGNLQWEVPNTSNREARPINVRSDGSLVVGGLGFGQVTALNPDGALQWAYTLNNDRLLAGPSVGPNGDVYAIANGDGAFSVDPTGTLNWVGDPFFSSSPNNSKIVFDSSRFFAALAGFTSSESLHVYDQNSGQEVWSTFSLQIPWNGFPVLDLAGRVIGPRHPTWVQALRADNGQLEWSAHHPGQVNFLIDQPQVDANGVVYTSDISGADLWAINPDGSTRWFHPHGDDTMHKVSVSPDAAVLFTQGVTVDDWTGIGARWFRGYATADGALLWQIDLPAENNVYPSFPAFDVVFTPDSRSAYVTTSYFAAAGNYGYLHAIAIGAEVGTTYCPGLGFGVACPCGNSSNTGGCANSTGNSAELLGTGSASVLTDDLTLAASSMPQNAPGLFFAGDTTISAPFGDGRRCVGGSVQRFPVQNTGTSGSASFDGVASFLGVAPGDTRHFQFWYRDPSGPCASSFNLSGALSVTFLP